MPIHVLRRLLHAMSGTELYRARTEFRLSLPESMGPAIPRIDEDSSHVGGYVNPADGRRANRKVPRNGVMGSLRI